MKKQPVSAVILCGGLSRRMQGADKGLQLFRRQPLFMHAKVRLQPQVEQLLINANRHQQHYAKCGLPVFIDELDGFLGPLSGMLSGLKHSAHDWVLFVPCDSPFLPLDLAERLLSAVSAQDLTLAYASDGEREHPTFALLHKSLAADLRAYLQQGGRKVRDFMRRQRYAVVDFSDQPQAFANVNYVAQLDELNREQPNSGIPMLGISGYSGSGKTTLLEKLLPHLQQKGLRVAVIKHTHHDLTTDKPGKDSWRMTQAGASQVAVACDQRWAIMTETPQRENRSAENQSAVSLDYLARQLDPALSDLILVEGFKQEPLPKILLHRQAMTKPLPQADEWVLALATDYPLPAAQTVSRLDLNAVEQIAEFIHQWWRQQRGQDQNGEAVGNG
ncbi:molybdopterin-guanine dinucleotide biosynthesis protein MobB/molybdenum cofactor guanylyltransferase,TIGR02665 [Pasteurella testudinis DSM 23072]|uniref:Molybdenum cofactor guanylyltransferase n=1 Tax=Pasteurella testudinis DSM 23072 TaxID=1122938 RepID=A0A1W1UBV4_9PAST|nr:molybdenum cofactor guanylyltransferase MobA [Pasteurella testudinis]SMB78533.1 molybdopterin-guanine dinucleotide biosynthesis protein MobB/molybdenum cofactor guanylyltransferase,TIGR02665 [Pasteurella testudinis DSM 23072]SUB52571.1 molybdopterin-guanine dinucleotide biosynthesis protein MobB [Pasteurella testudinis]